MPFYKQKKVNTSAQLKYLLSHVDALLVRAIKAKSSEEKEKLIQRAIEYRYNKIVPLEAKIAGDTLRTACFRLVSIMEIKKKPGESRKKYLGRFAQEASALPDMLWHDLGPDAQQLAEKVIIAYRDNKL